MSTGDLLEFYWEAGGFKHVINISADTGVRIGGDHFGGNPFGVIADGVVHAFARER
jgi:hypothetical protein